MQSSRVILVFAVTLVFAVLQSGLYRRTALSNSLLFLIVGFGVGLIGWLNPQPDNPALTGAVELALVSVLFTDSMSLDFKELRENWDLPKRALFLGLPITLILIAILGVLFFQLPIAEALLVGAVLSPTDPALASDFLEREEIPLRVRRLLNIESGLNDGLALPLILILLSIVRGEDLNLVKLGIDLIGGISIGILIPWFIHKLANSQMFLVEEVYRPIYVLSIGVTVVILAKITGTNTFLAAFCAGVAVASLDEQARDAFLELGKIMSELLKLTALFIFGALLTPALFINNHITSYVFACLVLVFARPVAIFSALINTHLPRLEKVTLAWFGPKGFSSLLYVLLVWQSRIPRLYPIFSIIALTLVISILSHSSTGLLFVRRFQRRKATAE